MPTEQGMNKLCPILGCRIDEITSNRPDLLYILRPTAPGLTVAAWLQRRPGIEIVARDCSTEYAAAATVGAPKVGQLRKQNSDDTQVVPKSGKGSVLPGPRQLAWLLVQPRPSEVIREIRTGR